MVKLVMEIYLFKNNIIMLPIQALAVKGQSKQKIGLRRELIIMIMSCMN